MAELGVEVVLGRDENVLARRVLGAQAHRLPVWLAAQELASAGVYSACVSADSMSNNNRTKAIVSPVFSERKRRRLTCLLEGVAHVVLKKLAKGHLQHGQDERRVRHVLRQVDANVASQRQVGAAVDRLPQSPNTFFFSVITIYKISFLAIKSGHERNSIDIFAASFWARDPVTYHRRTSPGGSSSGPSTICPTFSVGRCCRRPRPCGTFGSSLRRRCCSEMTCQARTFPPSSTSTRGSFL